MLHGNMSKPFMIEFFDKAMQPLLFLRIESNSLIGNPRWKSSSRSQSQVACQVVLADAMYLASVVNRATVDYRQDFQAIVPP
jgi:hypothetical protein